MTAPSIRDPWHDLMMRLRQASLGGRCKAMMRVSILVENGNPVAWAKPEVTPIEPASATAIDILDSLCYNEGVTDGAHPL